MELERERYRKEIDGQKVDLYTLENKSGMVVKITNWGAKVQQILVPDKEGVLGDVALGYDSRVVRTLICILQACDHFLRLNFADHIAVAELVGQRQQ